MNAARGDVLWATDPFRDGDAGRPWLVVSNESTPYQGDQFVCLALTSKGYHGDAVPVRSDDALPSESYAWSVRTVESDDIARQVGSVREGTVSEAVARLTTYVERTG
jgi:mRNA interferase MazF